MQAICMASPTNQEGEQEWFVGILQEVAYPCEEGEVCPPCLTVALRTDDRKTYYLTGLDEQWQEVSELTYQWFSHPLFPTAAIEGIPYTSGSFDYIQVSKIWIRCMSDVSTCSGKTYIEISGTLQPKVIQSETEDVPDCQTVVLETSEREYYLYWRYLSKDLQILLDTMQSPLQVTIKGEKDCTCIIAYDIIENHPITSLCNTWNVLFVRMGANGDELSTEVHRLTTDTVINGKTYVQLYIYGNYGVRDRVTYRGALREDNNANVYIVPANSDHEYLLYAFNAKVGDKLSNLWIGGAAETGGLPDGLNARVADITETSPRIFTLYLNANDNMDVIEDLPIQWIEGVGLTDCPGGSICPGILGCACSCGHIMLCAYKDGKQVYASEEAEKYGCYYDSYEQAGDTVKLYRHVNDGPGSSTVDPVDPNQIVVILQQDLLIMREYTGEEIQYTLQKSLASNAPAKANAPAMSKRVQADSFRGSTSLRLTENGTYRLDLTNPDWNYSIYGVFDYGTVGLYPVIPDATATKVIRNGHLLIQKGDKIYTLTGVEIQ